MKKKWITFCFIVLAGFSLFSLGGNALAQENGNVAKLLDEIKTYIVNIAAHFGLDATNPPEEPPKTPGVDKTQQANLAETKNTQDSTIIPTTAGFNPKIDLPPYDKNNPMTMTQQAVHNILKTPQTCPEGVECTSAESIAHYMSGLGISRPLPTQETYGAGQPKSEKGGPNPADKSLNAQSLIGPVAFQTEQGQSTGIIQALSFIRFLSGQANPKGVPDLKKLEELDPLEANRYLVNLRQFAASQSVGLNNLFQMLARRLTVPKLGEEAGMDKTDASQLEVANFVARRRVNNSNKWYEEMEKAPPITVQRETLYVLAEIQNQLNEMRLLNERVLLTLTAMQLQSIPLVETYGAGEEPLGLPSLPSFDEGLIQE